MPTLSLGTKSRKLEAMTRKSQMEKVLPTLTRFLTKYVGTGKKEFYSVDLRLIEKNATSGGARDGTDSRDRVDLSMKGQVFQAIASADFTFVSYLPVNFLHAILLRIQYVRG